MNKLWVCSASALLAAGSALPVMAQDSDGIQLEEIVVTAEKREENLQKVATSIQVKNGDDLRKSGKKRIDEIMEGTVGIQAQGSPTGTAFYIRGVEPAGAGRGTPVTTPIIVDGVAQNRTEVVRASTLDVSQVEIMRGPQSTTLGANSLSGAISVVTNKPVFEYQGSGTLEYGNYNKQSMEGVLNVPLSDSQALRFAYSSDRRDGYYSNGSGDTDVQNARLKYRLKSSDDLDTVISISHQKIGGNGSELGVRSTGHWTPYTGTASAAVNCLSIPAGYSDAVGCPVRYVWNNDGTTFRTRSNAWDDGLPAFAWGWRSYQNTTIDQANVEIDWNTGIGTVVIEPSFQRSHTQTLEGPMGLTGGNMAGYAIEDIRENTTSLDARINSNADSIIKWQAGVRYNKDDYGLNQFDRISFPVDSDPMDAGTPCYQKDALCYLYDLTPDQVTENNSIYANGEYSVLDNLRIIGGLNYNRDKASVAQLSTVNGDANGPYASEVATATLTTGSRTWNKATYRAGFEWDVLPETMLYATYSTGYTPGTVNGMTLNGTDPVTLKQISAGWKSQWLDNRLQFNGEFFSTKFYNRSANIASVSNSDAGTCSFTMSPPGAPAAGVNGIEVVSTSGAGYCANVSGTVQVPEVLSKGLDMDMTWLLSAEDRLVLTAEWLDTKYNQRPVVIGGFDASSAASIQAAITAANSGIDATHAADLAAKLDSNLAATVGAQLQNAPKYSATLAYSHEFDLGTSGRLMPRIEATYKDKYWSAGELGMPGAPTVKQILANTNDGAFWQSSYVKWDANLDWTNADGKFDVNAYVKNIQNKVIMTSYSTSVVQLAAPRTFGVTFSANF
jgi:iron complex outermembrane recepter protein